MATKLCPNCGGEFNSQGFHFHEKKCKPPTESHREVKVMYPKQKEVLSPQAYEKFLTKAGSR